MALEDRHRPVYRTSHNHYTRHALGSVLLLIDALEAWLNEVIHHTASMAGFHEIRALADANIMRKYREIPEGLGGASLPSDPQLEAVVAVRVEIAHFLPRGRAQWTDNLPPAVQPLQREGLLITYENPEAPGVDFHWTQKLASYSLAYWSWRVVDSAVERLLEALRPNERLAGLVDTMIAPAASHNFRMYRQVCPPDALDQFDEQQSGAEERGAPETRPPAIIEFARKLLAALRRTLIQKG
jgi:hypothetical protein